MTQLLRFTFSALLALLGSAAHGEPIKNEPHDFRGLTWAIPFDEKGAAMTLIRRDGDVAYYIRKSDTLAVGQADAIKIAYRFYKGRFSAGVVQTYGVSNKKTLIDILHDRHGESSKPHKRIEQYRWAGDEAIIELTCEATSYCVAEYVSTAVSRLEAAEGGGSPAAASAGKNDD